MYTVIVSARYWRRRRHAHAHPTPPTPTPTATPSTTPTTPPTLQLNNLVVSDSANKTNWSLETGIAIGSVQYGDRGYTISSLPTTLNGAAWVETANSSKTFTGNTIVSFDYQRLGNRVRGARYA